MGGNNSKLTAEEKAERKKDKQQQKTGKNKKKPLPPIKTKPGGSDRELPPQPTDSPKDKDNGYVGIKAATVIKRVKALHDYDKRQPDDLSFCKGDKLEILNDNEGGWWLARKANKQEQGYIPSNYVVPDTDGIESQDYWFPLERREAEKVLVSSGNSRGTFLIRPSTDANSYALSVFDTGNTIKHYKIRTTDSGGCYISPRKEFNDMAELLDSYKKSPDGLCCKLTKAYRAEPEALPFKDIEVDRKQIRLIKKLGQGNFGEVWLAKWQNQIGVGIEVAVKTLKEGQMTATAFLEEAKVMHKLRHRKLVQLMGVCSQSEPLYIITEFMKNGSLLDYMRKDEGKTVKLPHMIDMAAQIADGMAYLEEKSFIHRDLRAANILVGDSNVVKVADFGLAREDEVYEGNEDAKFPIKWTAPEAAFHRRFTIKSDVWSFGILLYEIITYGRVPYPGMTGAQVLQQVDGGYRMPPPRGCGGDHSFDCPDECYELMYNCWKKNPEDRPTFSFLHDTFADYAVSTQASYGEIN